MVGHESDVLGHRASLDLQLRQLQQPPPLTGRHSSTGAEGGVEERMMAFQRDCEDRARREIALGKSVGST